jgi:hypothetical protein
MAIDAAGGNPRATMSLVLENKLRRHAELAERWSDDDDPDELLARCRSLLIVADELEEAASAARSETFDPAVVGCLSEALTSLATVSLLLSQTASTTGAGSEDAAVPDPGRLLFAISQNLRFAAEAAGKVVG